MTKQDFIQEYCLRHPQYAEDWGQTKTTVIEEAERWVDALEKSGYFEDYEGILENIDVSLREIAGCLKVKLSKEEYEACVDNGDFIL